MSERGIIKCTLISLWSLSEVSAHIHLWVKCDSQQIPSNHGEAEDGKQHSFRKRDGKLSPQRDDCLFKFRPDAEWDGAFEKRKEEERYKEGWRKIEREWGEKFEECLSNSDGEEW